MRIPRCHTRLPWVAALCALALAQADAQFTWPPNPTLPRIHASFGVPVDWRSATLEYPEFTIRFQQDVESFRASDLMPWHAYHFEVLDREHRTIGGEILFNAEERANARRFDVNGKIYVAEMFSTTATPSADRDVSSDGRLPFGTMVVWDEATAAARNPKLHRIWEQEHIEANSRYSVPNTYVNGQRVAGSKHPGMPDFGEFSYLSHDGEHVVTMEVAAELASMVPGAAVAYGQPVNGRGRFLHFPDFEILEVGTATTNPTNPTTASRSFRFSVISSAGDRTGFEFDTANMANGVAFKVGGQTYFAEMFFTTAGRTPLRPEQFIVWDEATARAQNPRILTAWQARAAPDAMPAPTRFAGGVPVDWPFNATVMFQADGACRPDELDAPIRVSEDVGYEFPSLLTGSGLVGKVSGCVVIGTGGRPEQVYVSGGSCGSFQESAAEALRKLHFSMPRKAGQPSRVLVNFTWMLQEPNATTRNIQWY